MSSYIDVEFLIDEIRSRTSTENLNEPTWSANAITNLIRLMPRNVLSCTPIKDLDGELKCKNCGNIVSGIEYKDGIERLYLDQFCPQCGIKLDWNKVKDLHKQKAVSQPFIPTECAYCVFYDCEEIRDGEDWKWVHQCSKGKEHDWSKGICPDFK